MGLQPRTARAGGKSPRAGIKRNRRQCVQNATIGSSSWMQKSSHRNPIQRPATSTDSHNNEHTATRRTAGGSSPPATAAAKRRLPRWSATLASATTSSPTFHRKAVLPSVSPPGFTENSHRPVTMASTTPAAAARDRKGASTASGAWAKQADQAQVEWDDGTHEHHGDPADEPGLDHAEPAGYRDDAPEQRGQRVDEDQFEQRQRRSVGVQRSLEREHEQHLRRQFPKSSTALRGLSTMSRRLYARPRTAA